MLILTRKKNETIHIGDDVSITVVRISGNKVRIGISAPRETPVMRIELGNHETNDEIEAAA